MDTEEIMSDEEINELNQDEIPYVQLKMLARIEGILVRLLDLAEKADS